MSNFQSVLLGRSIIIHISSFCKAQRLSDFCIHPTMVWRFQLATECITGNHNQLHRTLDQYLGYPSLSRSFALTCRIIRNGWYTEFPNSSTVALQYCQQPAVFHKSNDYLVRLHPHVPCYLHLHQPLAQPKALSKR